jgi:glycosyltransferase involved in cell wall biosynthesis
MKNSPELDTFSIAPSSIIESSSTRNRAEVNSYSDLMNRPTIRVLALVEGSTVSGPAKNLFEFCRVARTLSTGPVVDIAVVTFQRSLALDCSRNTDLIDAARQADIAVERIPERFAFDAQVVSRLRKLSERFRPDLIQTHAAKSHFLLRCSGLWKDTPWIAFHHGYTNTDFRSPIYNNLDRWSLQVPERIVTVSLATKQQLQGRGIPGERIAVVHNAVQSRIPEKSRVDGAVFGQKKIDLGLSPDEKLILCVGRLSKEKAQIDMVAALHHLRQLRPNLAVRLMILGDGPEREPIAQAVRSAGLEKHVVFAGHLNDLAPYYEAADVVAIPSLSEGSPNVLLEAMAFGVPVVATEVGGIPEIVVHEDTALLVPARDAAAMAAAIDRLLSDPTTASALARLARKKVETDYSPESRGNSLVNIYADVYRRRRQ